MLKIIFKTIIFCIYLDNSIVLSNQQDTVETGKAAGDKGIEAFRQGNLILAMELLNRSAEQGYAPAQTTLAYILDQAEEDKRAFKLFQQAADNNYAAGKFGLGNMYAKGEGTEQNLILAGQWIKKSALQNHAPAMRAYAYALESGGLGFEKDSNQALHWYIKCSQEKDIICSRRLSDIYANGELDQAVNKEKSAEFKQLLNQSIKE